MAVLLATYVTYTSAMTENISGGYCGGVPPLPIPNREVKPACADGTAMQCGRVGGCLFSMSVPFSEMMTERFFCVAIMHYAIVLISMMRNWNMNIYALNILRFYS